MKYETLQISGKFVKFECQAPPHKCKAPYCRLSGDGSGAIPSVFPLDLVFFRFI